VTPSILEAQDLTKRFVRPRSLADWILRRRSRPLTALAGVDLSLRKGEIVGLVGESGCGKSTLGKCLVGIHTPVEGAVRMRDDPERRPLTRRLQMVFQDPFSSLNPRLTVGSILGEVLRLHQARHGSDLDQAVRDCLADVGLSADFADRLPHELSGGQRQRVSIARALAVEPEVVIADEPVSALDVSVQAQIINLLKRLAADRQLTLLFISHDLSVVFNLCERVVVMYMGQVVEEQSSDAMMARPLHPYSQGLLAAAPTADPDVPRPAAAIEGEPPDPFADFVGCRFAGRCSFAETRCRREVPHLRLVQPTGADGSMQSKARVRCHFAEAIDMQGTEL